MDFDRAIELIKMSLSSPLRCRVCGGLIIQGGADLDYRLTIPFELKLIYRRDDDFEVGVRHLTCKPPADDEPWGEDVFPIFANLSLEAREN